MGNTFEYSRRAKGRRDQENYNNTLTRAALMRCRKLSIYSKGLNLDSKTEALQPHLNQIERQISPGHIRVQN